MTNKLYNNICTCIECAKRRETYRNTELNTYYIQEKRHRFSLLCFKFSLCVVIILSLITILYYLINYINNHPLY